MKMVNYLSLIHSLVTISDNYRIVYFQNIIKLIDYLASDLKKQITNGQLYNLFKKEKKLLLLLFKKGIIQIDSYVLKKILSNTDDKFRYFFYPEIKSLISTELRERIEKELLSIDPQIFDTFEEKRLKGENDSYICELIRNDSIEKFTEYVALNNFQISQKIPPSIFETNHFLNKMKPSPIEYAAFFGSVQICKYLIMNDVPIYNSIGKFTIIGKNFDLIHLFESYNINMKSLSCLGHAIKYHYYDIMNYIIENCDENEKTIKQFLMESSLKYHNFEVLPKDVLNNMKEDFFFFSKYDYYDIVESLLK